MKDIEIAAKIKRMKVGQSFTVETSRDRGSFSRVACLLRNFGEIKIRVVTRRDKETGKFIVAAI